MINCFDCTMLLISVIFFASLLIIISIIIAYMDVKNLLCSVRFLSYKEYEDYKSWCKFREKWDKDYGVEVVSIENTITSNQDFGDL